MKAQTEWYVPGIQKDLFSHRVTFIFEELALAKKKKKGGNHSDQPKKILSS